MNLERPELLERLAAAYVLGTLRGRARSRFERAMTRSAPMRAQVDAWRARLLPLSAGLPPVEPPAAVKAALDARLFGAEAVRAGTESVAETPTPAVETLRREGTSTVPGDDARPVRPAPAAVRRTAAEPWWRRLLPWQVMTGMATAAALVLALRVAMPPADAPAVPGWMAVLEDTGGQPMAALRVTPARGGMRVAVRMMKVPADMPTDRALELWSVPEGGAPRSLGLLRDGERMMPPGLMAKLEGAGVVAVSVEPPGGSPTGAPTGPVIWHGALVRL